MPLSADLEDSASGLAARERVAKMGSLGPVGYTTIQIVEDEIQGRQCPLLSVLCLELGCKSEKSETSSQSEVILIKQLRPSKADLLTRAAMRYRYQKGCMDLITAGPRRARGALEDHLY